MACSSLRESSKVKQDRGRVAAMLLLPEHGGAVLFIVRLSTLQSRSSPNTAPAVQKLLWCSFIKQRWKENQYNLGRGKGEKKQLMQKKQVPHPSTCLTTQLRFLVQRSASYFLVKKKTASRSVALQAAMLSGRASGCLYSSNAVT